MNRNNEQYPRPDTKARGEKRPLTATHLRDEILRLSEMAKALNVPVVLSMPELDIAVRPDETVTFHPKYQLRTHSLDKPEDTVT